MTDGAFERRTHECQWRLRDRNAAALVCAPGTNLYYLTGIDEETSERHFLVVVPASGDAVLFVPELAGEQVKQETWIEDIRTWSDDDNPRTVLSELFDDITGQTDDRVLVDDRMWATFVLDLESALSDVEFGLASEVVSEVRARKDEREIDALQEAANVADEVSESLRTIGSDIVGMTESELAREIESRMRERGGEPSFETIVGSGPNGAHPHHRHGDSEIEAGDPVVLDFGCYLGAYPSDQTRTIVFGGAPSEGFEEAFDAVRVAQEAGVNAVEPGVPAQEVDRAAREVIEERGYGDAFVHRTGHGVGLDVHEEPYVTSENDRQLEPGMVFSVEPGIYLEGEFGVRIEDLVVVTEDGADRLNDSPRGWRP